MTNKKKEKAYKVRLSKPGNLVQKMTVKSHDPKTFRPLEKPMFEGIETTNKYRTDFEKRGWHKKMYFQTLNITFVRKQDVVLPGGKVERVAFRAGQDGDRIENAVEETMVPESLLHLFKPYVDLGYLIVEAPKGETWETDDKDFITEQVPETQAQAEEMGLSSEEALEQFGIKFEDPTDPDGEATVTKRGSDK